MKHQEALVKYCTRIGDTSLILGQRLAEWCGHGPVLEEDIALTNISLDLIGQTRAFYTYACQIETLVVMKTTWPTCVTAANSKIC